MSVNDRAKHAQHAQHAHSNLGEGFGDTSPVMVGRLQNAGSLPQVYAEVSCWQAQYGR